MSEDTEPLEFELVPPVVDPDDFLDISEDVTAPRITGSRSRRSAAVRPVPRRAVSPAPRAPEPLAAESPSRLPLIVEPPGPPPEVVVAPVDAFPVRPVGDLPPQQRRHSTRRTRGAEGRGEDPGVGPLEMFLGFTLMVAMFALVGALLAEAIF